MTLKNLERPIGQKGSRDAQIACTIIDVLFDQISLCIKSDNSKIKLSFFAKGMIQGMLGEKTKSGIKEYVNNMYDKDIDNLLDSIQKELDKRKILNIKDL